MRTMDENSSRLGVLNDRDQDPHICMHNLTVLFQNVMGVWLRFAYMNKSTVSRNMLLLGLFPRPLDFSTLLHSISR